MNTDKKERRTKEQEITEETEVPISGFEDRFRSLLLTAGDAEK
jgi:hypothetical protein